MMYPSTISPDSPDSPATRAATPSAAGPARAAQTVLVADDEPSLRLLVSATLASDRYTVVEAATGDEAWRLMQLHRPTVALLDVLMPGLTGLEVARATRADPALAGTRLILLTSRAQPADVAAGVAAGADLYLTKPFSPLELLTIVEQTLGLA